MLAENFSGMSISHFQTPNKLNWQFILACRVKFLYFRIHLFEMIKLLNQVVSSLFMFFHWNSANGSLNEFYWQSFFFCAGCNFFIFHIHWFELRNEKTADLGWFSFCLKLNWWFSQWILLTVFLFLCRIQFLWSNRSNKILLNSYTAILDCFSSNSLFHQPLFIASLPMSNDVGVPLGCLVARYYVALICSNKILQNSDYSSPNSLLHQTSLLLHYKMSDDVCLARLSLVSDRCGMRGRGLWWRRGRRLVCWIRVAWW